VALIAVVPIAVLSTACSSGTTEASGTPTITVAAAASLTDVFTSIGSEFTAETGIGVRFTFAGSSAIAEQIRGGAPLDVFASAGTTSMTPLLDEQLVTGVTDFATNSLMIAVPPGNPGNVQSLDDLAGVSVVMCQEQVPCGVTTTAMLERISLAIAPVSLEPDVRSVLTKIETDEADAGIVYVTDVAASAGTVIGIAIPASANVTTLYQAAVVTESPAADPAAAFVSFLTGETAQQLLADAGFGPPETAP
jgi:molybdate transport system substrate-binding protein